MTKSITRAQKGLAGVREYLKSQERQSINKKQMCGLSGVTYEEVVRRVFDKHVTLADRSAFTPTNGKVYGGMVKRIYGISKISSVYEGWSNVAAQRTREICGSGSLIKFGDTVWGNWLMRDESAVHVLENQLREQLEILTGRTL
jgi:hypothetical protein